MGFGELISCTLSGEMSFESFFFTPLSSHVNDFFSKIHGLKFNNSITNLVENLHRSIHGFLRVNCTLSEKISLKFVLPYVPMVTQTKRKIVKK